MRRIYRELTPRLGKAKPCPGPEWRNGRRRGFKILRLCGCASSNLASGTIPSFQRLLRLRNRRLRQGCADLGRWRRVIRSFRDFAWGAGQKSGQNRRIDVDSATAARGPWQQLGNTRAKGGSAGLFVEAKRTDRRFLRCKGFCEKSLKNKRQFTMTQHEAADLGGKVAAKLR